MDEAEVIECDLRRACLHEHAHMAVAIHLGANPHLCSVSVRPNEKGGLEQKHFTGSFRYFGHDLTASDRRLIGLAGSVATILDSNYDDGWDTDPCEIADWIATGLEELSPTDAEIAVGYGQCEVERCVELVEALWPMILEKTADEVRRWTE